MVSLLISTGSILLRRDPFFPLRRQETSRLFPGGQSNKIHLDIHPDLDRSWPINLPSPAIPTAPPMAPLPRSRETGPTPPEPAPFGRLGTPFCVSRAHRGEVECSFMPCVRRSRRRERTTESNAGRRGEMQIAIGTEGILLRGSRTVRQMPATNAPSNPSLDYV